MFCCSLSELGWPDAAGSSRELHEELMLLDSAMIVDLVERLAGMDGFSVVVHETDENLLGSFDQTQPRFVRIRQRPGFLKDRIGQAVAGFYHHNDGASLVVIYGRNPLLSPFNLRVMEQFLHQEEEVIVIAEQKEWKRGLGVVAAATRSNHPSLYTVTGETDRANAMEPFLGADALLWPVQPVHDCAGMETLPWLLHEVERPMLLGRWYPRRTLAALYRMQRKGIIGRD